MGSTSLSGRDLTYFGTRIEEVLEASLTQANIPLHHVEYHPTKNGKAAVELVPFFSNHLQAVEDLLCDLFVINADQSVCLEQRFRNNEQLPASYMAYLDPLRKTLPEWKPFAEEPIQILVSSLFQGALFSILGFFSGEDFSDDPDITAEIRFFSQRVKELDEGFSSLADRHLGSSGQRGTDPIREDQEEVTSKGKPAPLSPPPDAGGETLDMASVRLYLNAGTKIVRMCLSVASESGVTVLVPGNDPDSEAGLTRLFNFLTQHGIRSYVAMEQYFTDKLGTWENIYEAFELTRGNENQSSQKLGLYDLALILIKAREALFFQSP